MDIFIKRLKSLREEYGYNQKELAKIAGLSPSGICMIERGRQNPNIQTAISIAKAFNVSLDYLFGLNDLGVDENFRNQFSPDEKRMIYMYRKLNDDIKYHFFEVFSSISHIMAKEEN